MESQKNLRKEKGFILIDYKKPPLTWVTQKKNKSSFELFLNTVKIILNDQFGIDLHKINLLLTSDVDRTQFYYKPAFNKKALFKNRTKLLQSLCLTKNLQIKKNFNIPKALRIIAALAIVFFIKIKFYPDEGKGYLFVSLTLISNVNYKLYFNASNNLEINTFIFYTKKNLEEPIKNPLIVRNILVLDTIVRKQLKRINRIILPDGRVHLVDYLNQFYLTPSKYFIYQYKIPVKIIKNEHEVEYQIRIKYFFGEKQHVFHHVYEFFKPFVENHVISFITASLYISMEKQIDDRIFDNIILNKGLGTFYATKDLLLTSFYRFYNNFIYLCEHEYYQHAIKHHLGFHIRSDKNLLNSETVKFFDNPPIMSPFIYYEQVNTLTEEIFPMEVVKYPINLTYAQNKIQHSTPTNSKEKKKEGENDESVEEEGFKFTVYNVYPYKRKKKNISKRKEREEIGYSANFKYEPFTDDDKVEFPT